MLSSSFGKFQNMEDPYHCSAGFSVPLQVVTGVGFELRPATEEDQVVDSSLRKKR